MPRSQMSEMFFRNKVSLYNFNVYRTLLSEVRNVWSKTDAGRRANELSTYMYRYMVQKIEEECRKFIFYSDNCEA